MPFRKHTLLPLDDCRLYALQTAILLTLVPAIAGVQRHGISRLPGIEGDKTARKQKFKSHPTGYFQVDIAEVPYTSHTILTGRDIQFCNHERRRYVCQHIFDRVGMTNHIQHRLIRINHPWTNGQVERINRTLKGATVMKFYFQTHPHLKKYL